MKRLVIVLPRAFAWLAALGALGLVVANYDKLPELIPTTRWSSAARSPLVAIRVPTINLLCVLLIEVLARALRRTSRPASAEAVTAVLLLTAGTKAALECAELLLLPARSAWILVTLAVVLFAGIGTAVAVGQRFMLHAERQLLAFSTAEKVITGLALAGIFILQITS